MVVSRIRTKALKDILILKITPVKIHIGMISSGSNV
jgi:hypothetical protein